MKRRLITAAALLLLTPFAASADMVATGSMTLFASYPAQVVDFDGSGTSLNYYADYDATFGAMTLKPAYTSLTFKSGEVFCVENTDMYTANSASSYDFYTSDALNSWAAGSREIVTWIANWALATPGSGELTGEDRKAAAQVAIWDTVIASATFSSSTYYTAAQTLINETYLAAQDKNAYVNDWLLAVSPTQGALGGVVDYQNFLVKATAAPVPEPATMLLFGTGLAGLAGIARRRKKN